MSGVASNLGARDGVFTKTITIGRASFGTGKVQLKGTTSGTVTVTVNAVAGTWTLTLPASAGSANQFLKTDGSGVASWGTVAPVGVYTAQAISFNATSNSASFITGNNVVVTLPASPADGDYVIIVDGASVTGCSVARNGKTIMGLSQDMTVDLTNFQFTLVYRSATGDWRLAL